MALNLISNFAASVAHRNLTATDMQASDSLSKLSSGTRVVSAKDDAASLAIGKRLAAEVEGLKTAQVNAGQAQSMLQIADGALSTISDVLTRMKALATQSSSGQLSSTERTFLDNEYQALISEIDRIAADTEFNGTKLLNGSTTFSATVLAGSVNIQSNDGFELFTFGTNPGSTYLSATDTIEIDYNATTNLMTLTNQVTNNTQTVSVTAAPAAGEFLDVEFSDFGVTLKLNSQFNASLAISANNEATVAGAASTTVSLNFRVGTGVVAAQDEVAVTLDQATAAQLATGLDTSDITDVTNSETAIGLLSTAIDQVNTIRANVGTGQNRIGFASSNLAASIENAEAARSNLLDLDVAKEMTTFTGKQVLLQAGVAMLAQANTLPQNLLRLLQ